MCRRRSAVLAPASAGADHTFSVTPARSGVSKGSKTSTSLRHLLSARNLPQVHILEPGQLNTYDVLVSDDVVFTQAAFESFVSGAPARSDADTEGSEA